jgi:hypothetical protein
MEKMSVRSVCKVLLEENILLMRLFEYYLITKKKKERGERKGWEIAKERHYEEGAGASSGARKENFWAEL